MKQNKKYLEVKLDKTDLFKAQASFKLMNFERDSIDVRIVLGYPYTIVPIRTLGADSATASALKEFDEKLGSEIINSKCTHPCEASCDIKLFSHVLHGLTLNGYPLGDVPCYADYDREGDIIIGTDLLRIMEIHYGVSQRTFEFLFLGCMKSQADKRDFFRAMEDNFAVYIGNKGLQKQTDDVLNALEDITSKINISVGHK